MAAAMRIKWDWVVCLPLRELFCSWYTRSETHELEHAAFSPWRGWCAAAQQYRQPHCWLLTRVGPQES